jgi:hypothetical protein
MLDLLGDRGEPVRPPIRFAAWTFKREGPILIRHTDRHGEMLAFRHLSLHVPMGCDLGQLNAAIEEGIFDEFGLHFYSGNPKNCMNQSISINLLLNEGSLILVIAAYGQSFSETNQQYE